MGAFKNWVPNLPEDTSLSGSELITLVDANVSKRVTLLNAQAPPYALDNAGGTVTLTKTSARFRVIQASCTIVLPDATTLALGTPIRLLIQTTAAVTIKDGAGTTLNVFHELIDIQWFLSDNSDAAGSWGDAGYLATVYGGTGNDLSGTGPGFLKQVSLGSVVTVSAIAQADVTSLVGDLAAKQPLDSDLTAIAALTPSDDDIIQHKTGAWTNRTLAQYRSDLGFVFSPVAPVLANFTWFNQGSNTAVVTNGVLVMTAPGDGSLTLRGMFIAKSGVTDLKVCIQANIAASKSGMGIGFREASSGKMVAFYAGATPEIIIQQWSSNTAVNGTLLGGTGVLFGSTFWLRITDDGTTNRKYYISADGLNWTQVYSEGRTTYFTSDQVIFFIHTSSTAFVNYQLSMPSWDLT